VSDRHDARPAPRDTGPGPGPLLRGLGELSRLVVITTSVGVVVATIVVLVVLVV